MECPGARRCFSVHRWRSALLPDHPWPVRSPRRHPGSWLEGRAPEHLQPSGGSLHSRLRAAPELVAAARVLARATETIGLPDDTLPRPQQTCRTSAGLVLPDRKLRPRPVSARDGKAIRLPAWLLPEHQAMRRAVAEALRVEPDNGRGREPGPAA